MLHNLVQFEPTASANTITVVLKIVMELPQRPLRIEFFIKIKDNDAVQSKWYVVDK